MNALLLAIAASVTVHVSETDRVSLNDAVAIAGGLADAIEARTGVAASLDDPNWSRCPETPECLDTIRARTSARIVVTLRILGGATRIRVAATRHQDGDTERFSATLPSDADGWPVPIAELAASLFPIAKTSPPPPTTAVTATVAERPPSLVPWFVLGGSALVAAVGVGFGVASASDGDTLASTALPASRHDELTSRLKSRAITADVLFAVALGGVTTAAILWLID